MKAHEFDRLSTKLNLTTHDTHHRIAWFIHEGRRVTKTRCSQGRGDVVLDRQVSQQLLLTREQLRGILDCSLNRGDYVKILMDKGQIPS